MVKLIIFSISFMWLYLFPTYTEALTINADKIIHFSKEGKYEVVGNVVIEYEGAIIKTQKALVYEGSFDVVAEGKVIYEDSDTFINAMSANLNLKTKTGEIQGAVIFFKQGNYWIYSQRLQRLSEDRYFANSARFTTCNPTNIKNAKDYTYDKAVKDTYDWCFQGRDVDIVLGKNIDAKEVTYRVRDFPLLYSPKIWAAINNERSSGFLMPLVGNSSEKGLRFAPYFFWAIDEDKDMTFGLDYYSKRGLGKSLQYRYIHPDSKGVFNMYHLRDKVLQDTQFQVSAQQEYNKGAFREFIDINYVKSIDMYKDYAYINQERNQRLLQSSIEAGYSFTNSRLYLLGQYWIDLKQKDKEIPQVLPSIGYYLNPTKIGPFLFEMESTISNFYRQSGLKSQRFDLMPKFSHSFGNEVQISQSLALRETVYNFQNNDESLKNHRESLRYTVEAKSRFIKRYEGYEHIIEPSINYQYIPKNNTVPVFDYTESINNISEANLSFLNLFRFTDKLIAVRLTQPYWIKNVDDGYRLGLMTFEGAYLTKPFVVRVESAYDFNERQIETFYTDVVLSLSEKTNLVFGERFSRDNSIFQYRTSIDTVLTNRWGLSANLWFDAKGGGLRDSNLRIKYMEQCWAINLSITRRPRFNDQSHDYSILALVELKGIGSIGKK